MTWLALILVPLSILPFASERIWCACRRWFRVLWACRVSVASVLLGFLLLELVPQARDLFADTSAGPGRWIAFFLLMFVGWASAVHYSARQALGYDGWAVARDLPEPIKAARRLTLADEYRVPIAWVPRLLGLVCFAAIGRGVWLQYHNLATAAHRLPSAHDALDQMFYLLAGTILAALAFAAYVVWRGAYVATRHHPTWADLWHALAAPQKTLRSDPLWFRSWISPSRMRSRLATERHDVENEAMALAYFVLLVATLGIALVQPLWLSRVVSLSLILVAMLGAWVLPLTYVTIWSNRVGAPLLLLLFVGTSVVTLLSTKFHDIRLSAPEDFAQQGLDGRDRQVSMNEAVAQWKMINCVGDKQERCPAPVIIAGQGGASRAAFFLGSVVGRVIDETRQDPIHYAPAERRIFALSTVSGSSLGAAVIRAGLESARLSRDPGATAPQLRPPCRRRTESWFAPDDEKDVPRTWEECFQTILAGDFLSPAFVGVAFRDHISLYDPIAALPLWGDRAALLERSWEAQFRAVVDARRPVGAKKEPGLARPLGYVKKTVWEAEDGIGWLPLLFLNGTSVNTGHRIIASDVKPYYCDTSSGATTLYPKAFDIFEMMAGREIPLSSFQQFCRSPTRGIGPLNGDWAKEAPDLRLSTAAAMSARFPIVSPAGSILRADSAERSVVDRVIDGGYFENDGLATALDVARVLKEEGLQPVIVRVTNDPVPRRPAPPELAAVGAGGNAVGTRVAAGPDEQGIATPERADPPGVTPETVLRPGSNLALPQAADHGIFEPIVSPLIGLYNTRQGHGAESADAAVKMVATERGPPRFIEFRVWDRLGEDGCRPGEKPAEIMEVSMSWWLSQPIQAYLAEHVCDGANAASLKELKDYFRRDNLPAIAPAVTRYPQEASAR